VHASDRNAGALRLAQKNAASAGLAPFIHFERRDAAEVAPPGEAGLLAVNPPYGRRLSAEVEAAWKALGALLARAPGWRAAVLAPERGLDRHLPRRTREVARVRNGGLACRLLLLDR
jgi:putative N6-adenine-specific DNA methylase